MLAYVKHENSLHKAAFDGDFHQNFMSYIRNKKATFNYEIKESLEAGIELFGYEAKSVRAGKGNLEGSYIIVRGGEAFLIGALISPYQQANTPESYDERRNRRLILHKKEIQKLADLGRGNGETVVPIAFYNRASNRAPSNAASTKPGAKSAKSNKRNKDSVPNGIIKLEIAIVRGKKKHDKRQTISKRETSREIHREIKGYR